LVAYGSLVNPDSAALTLKTNLGQTRVPVVATGVRRLFSFVIPSDQNRYGPPETPSARGALNTEYTGLDSDTVNGVLLEIHLEDLPAFRKREVGYNLFRVPCRKWSQSGKPTFDACILVCPDRNYPDLAVPMSELEPHRRYYQVCREGAARIGAAFLDAWLSNTYLVDGVTPVSEWEKKVFPAGLG